MITKWKIIERLRDRLSRELSRLPSQFQGHGTDAMIEAFHLRGGKIRKRVPFIKIIASALTMGTGGSAGKEGPIAQIGSGFGSMLGTIAYAFPQMRIPADGGNGENPSCFP